MEEIIKSVQNKLNNNSFNLSAISRATYISRPTLDKVKNGKQVSPKVIITLNDYFKKLGE